MGDWLQLKLLESQRETGAVTLSVDDEEEEEVCFGVWPVDCFPLQWRTLVFIDDLNINVCDRKKYN